MLKDNTEFDYFEQFKNDTFKTIVEYYVDRLFFIKVCELLISLLRSSYKYSYRELFVIISVVIDDKDQHEINEKRDFVVRPGAFLTIQQCKIIRILRFINKLNVTEIVPYLENVIKNLKAQDNYYTNNDFSKVWPGDID